jgi:glyoxylase-like metal-dependent hydrolase (beta-lactamase superfamily II)
MTLNALLTNTYFIYNEETLETIIVDPAWDSKDITGYIEKNGLKPVAVLLTHGHFDHIYGVRMLQDKGVTVIAPEKEKELLGDVEMNLSKRFKKPVSAVPDKTVTDGDVLELAGFSVRVIETPGHTSGSVCYEFPKQNVIFTGDTLFNGTIGRTDVPTGDWEVECDSVRNKLFVLPEKMICYPGHGSTTTIGHEKMFNTAVN